MVAMLASIPLRAEEAAEPDPPHAEADAGAEGCQGGACEDAGAKKPDDVADAGSEAPPQPRPTRVTLEGVTFENGEVPRAQRALEKLAEKELSACATANGGVSGQGTVELKFLVRSRGRAEGVEVAKARNVPPEVARCLAFTLSRRPVGAPSDEPVFVTAKFKLVEDKLAGKPKGKGR